MCLRFRAKPKRDRLYPPGPFVLTPGVPAWEPANQLNPLQLALGVLVSSISPVFTVVAGSMTSRWVSASAAVVCSTPLGTTISSPGLQPEILVPESEQQPALQHQEQLFLLLVAVPDKLAL